VRRQSRFVCQSCGHSALKWLGKCPDCGAWNSFVEETVQEQPKGVRRKASTTTARVHRLAEVESPKARRIATGIRELDLVLGGGIVPGSVVRIGGEPGIGKSTLVLQVAGRADSAGSILYVAGEESPQQAKLRAERLGVDSDSIYLLAETDVESAIEAARSLPASMVIVDSIQTMTHSAIESGAGSISQVRTCAEGLTQLAKSDGIPVFLVGHVTKEGAIAGPRVLEHMVDTVLYFEGDPHHAYRILRSVKNRFGSTDEIAVFEMTSEGLKEVANPSDVFLADRLADASGSVVTSTLEGTRPILCEIQALAATSYFPVPKRTTSGVDYNRVGLLCAVLEKRGGVNLAGNDIYVNVAGGIRVDEPALDLAIVAAVASSHRDKVIDPKTIVFGEVGLAGEVRPVPQAERRLREAANLGFGAAVVPSKNAKNLRAKPTINVKGVETVRDALAILAPWPKRGEG
jgi:DNA repair protein RadA/Sms